MFIYHFSRLIKSKLLWAFLALLMVFAFVVMDSCTGPTGDYSAGYLKDEPVNYATVEDASQSVTIMQSNSRWFLPQQGQIFAAVMNGETGADDYTRSTWKLIAASTLANELGLTANLTGAEKALERTFVDANGVFNPNRYRNFLAQSGYREPRLFEKTYANVWLPAQTLTSVVFNSVGWASPMEQDFSISAMHDKTTVYAATLKNTIDAATLPVTEADENAWYAAHQDDYELPEQRLISYVEVKAAPFAEKITVEEIDAMQYYDDNSDEFKGTGTNATKTLPFEEVKDKAIAKVKEQRALEEALTYANETLVAQALTGTFADVAKPYGDVKQVTVRMDRPTGFQNARDVIATAFEMDPADTPINAVSGTDCVYLIRLEKVIPEHVAPLADVKERVQTAVRQDQLDKRLKANGETIRGLLAAELAKGSAFDQAVAACKVEGLTATTAMTFVVSNASSEEIPYRTEIMPVVSSLGTKAVSDPVLTADKELVLVYVADRQPGDVLAKATAKATLAGELSFNTAFQVSADWLEWNLDKNPPVTDKGLPILQDDEATEE